MNILITGITGLLGDNIARVHQVQGHAVRGLTRAAGPGAVREGLDADSVHGDILDPNAVRLAVRGCDAIIHAAAETRQWPTPVRYYESHIAGTRNALATAEKSGVGRLIHISTVDAFAHGTKDRPGTEECEFAGGSQTPGHVQSKILAQRLTLDAARSAVLPVVVNPAFLLGPIDPKPSPGRLIITANKKRFVPVPPGGRNFVHDGDAAKAAAGALTLGAPGQCHILANENLTYAEFFDKMTAVTGNAGLKNMIPAAAPKSFGAVSGFLARSRPPLDASNARWLCASHYYSAAEAVRELGLLQTPIEKAIADAVESFLRKGCLK
jgi:dihydroflavonol-4-reductase